MSFLLFGTCTLIAGGGLLAWFFTFPPRAAVFPVLIVFFCFIFPGAAALVRGVRNREPAKLFVGPMAVGAAKCAEYLKTRQFRGTLILFVLTVLYVVGTHFIGFFPSSLLYFPAVLLGVYRMPVKGTLIYTVCSIAFLYIFFAVIFRVSA